VIAENNDQLGVMDTRDAVSMARERGFDLILVAPQAQPPVCRIMDYGKYKYEKSKKEKKVKSAANELKMVRLHPRTGPHDRDILVRHSERFLREGHKVRVVCQFKGRENAYPELGKTQLDAIANSLAEIATVEGTVTKVGRDMTMMLTPKPGIKPLPKLTKGASKGKDDEEPAEEAEFEALQERLAAEAHDEENDNEGISEVEDSETEDSETEEAEA
jgi:translation initiation factor IF-3